MKNYFQNYDGKIALTSDIWSSKSKYGFMSLTAHYVDNAWNLTKKIISFKTIEYPHTGIVVGCEIMEGLEKWGSVQKVLSISLDNATYNDVVEEYLQMWLDLPLNSECVVAHTF